MALILVVLALFFRLDRMFNALEYDEIWTLEFFAFGPVKRIFTELALPNNHPLNSLLVKLMVAIAPTPFMIRLPALLSGLLAIPAAGLLAFYFFRRRSTALWTMFFLVFAAPLAGYAQQARGYSLQFFLCTLFGLGLLMLGRFRPARCRYLPEVMLLFSGLGAVLTLPTSVLYLAPAALLVLGGGGYAAWRREPGKYRVTLMAGVAGGLAILAWYLFNFQQYRQAQRWSIALDGIGGYFGWLGSVFGEITTCPVLLLALLGLILSRPARRLLLVLLFPLLAAPLTNAGPPRTYLVLLLPLSLLAAAGADQLLRLIVRRLGNPKRARSVAAVLAAVLLLATVGAGYRQLAAGQPTDWYAVHRDAKELPPEIIVSFQATAGYPLAWNNRPEAHQDFVRRLTHDEPGPRWIAFIGRDAVNGTDLHGAEQEIPLSGGGKALIHGSLSGYLYRLEEIADRPKEGEIVVCRIGPAPIELAKQLSSSLVAGQEAWLWLNNWLCMEISRGTEKYRYFLLAAKVTPELRLDILGLKRRYHKYIDFYRLAAEP